MGIGILTIEEVMKMVLSGMISFSEGEVLGWILSGILGDNDQQQEILDDLANMQEQLTEIADELAEVEITLQKIQMELQWDTLWPLAQPNVNSINNHFSDLQKLNQADNPSGQQQNAQQLANAILAANTGTANDLAQVRAAIYGESLSGGQPGLLVDWGTGVIEQMLQGWTGIGLSIEPLLKATRSIEDYFRLLISVQTQGTILLVEALHSANDTAAIQTVLKTYYNELHKQSELFLHMIEQAVVSYYVDQKVLGSLIGRQAVMSPLQHADQFVKHANAHQFPDDSQVPASMQNFANHYNENTLTVRIWYGTGTGSQAFSTGTNLAISAGDRQNPNVAKTPATLSLQPVQMVPPYAAVGDAVAMDSLQQDQLDFDSTATSPPIEEFWALRMWLFDPILLSKSTRPSFWAANVNWTAQWAVFRYTFVLGTPSAEGQTYQLTPAIPNQDCYTNILGTGNTALPYGQTNDIFFMANATEDGGNPDNIGSPPVKLAEHYMVNLTQIPA